MADIGHNSEVINAQAKQRLRSFVERAERLNDDKAAVGADLKELFAEIKSDGFDTKIVRKVIRLRSQDRARRQEEEAVLDLYMTAVGEGEL